MHILKRFLIILAIPIVLALKAQGAVLSVGEICVAFEDTNQLASFSFDSESRKLFVRTLNLKDPFDWSVSSSEPIVTPPRFEDRKNPLKIVNLHDGRVGFVVFTTKNTISIQSGAGTLAYYCQKYYPGQLGMRY